MFEQFIVIFRAVIFDINIDDRDVCSKLMGKSPLALDNTKKWAVRMKRKRRRNNYLFGRFLCLILVSLSFSFGRAHNERVCNMWCVQVSKGNICFSRSHVKALIVECSSQCICFAERKKCKIYEKANLYWSRNWERLLWINRFLIIDIMRLYVTLAILIFCLFN